MKFILLVAALVACHHHVQQDIRAAEEDKLNTVKATEETVAETKKQDPTDVETKTTHEDNAVVVQAPDGTVQVAKVVKNRPLVLPKGSKVIGIVPLSSTVKDENKHVGGTVDEKNTQKKSTEDTAADKTTTLGVKTDDELDAGPGWQFYSCIIGAVIAVLVGGYFYLKLVKKVSWL
jgi:hypothetical protein